MSQKEENFIYFISNLWEKHPECFTSNPWTDRLEGEEWAFSVFLRTIIWNDPESIKLYKKIQGYKGTLEKYRTLSPSQFEEWFNEQQSSILIGGKNQGGAHRKQFHKKDNPRALRKYLDKTSIGQINFFMGKSFDQLYQEIIQIPSIGKLLSFDILSRLVQTRHNYLELKPLKAYETGGGPIKGLQAIYCKSLSKPELMKLYQQLGEKIQVVADIPPRIFWFELENILCIYQKKNIKEKSMKMLSGHLNPLKYSHLYAKEFCSSVRGCNDDAQNECC